MVGGAVAVVFGQWSMVNQFCLVQRKRKREREREREKSDGERKEMRKKYKIMICTAIVTMYICTITIAIVHLCTILHPLMWVFFWSVHISTLFSILHLLMQVL